MQINHNNPHPHPFGWGSRVYTPTWYFSWKQSHRMGSKKEGGRIGWTFKYFFIL